MARTKQVARKSTETRSMQTRKRSREALSPAPAPGHELGNIFITATHSEKQHPAEPRAANDACQSHNEDCSSAASPRAGVGPGHGRAAEAAGNAQAECHTARVPFEYLLPVPAWGGRQAQASQLQTENLLVASCCSTDLKTWLAGGSILYPAQLSASDDATPAGAPAALPLHLQSQS